MKKQFINSFVYVTPLTKPFLNGSGDKIKVDYISQEKGLYEKLDFSKLEKEGKNEHFKKSGTYYI